MSSPGTLPIERRIRLSAAAVAIGILILGASLAWLHPLALLLGIGLGGLLIAAGAFAYLIGLVTLERDR